jgi:hypothetical protein
LLAADKINPSPGTMILSPDKLNQLADFSAMSRDKLDLLPDKMAVSGGGRSLPVNAFRLLPNKFTMPADCVSMPED